ncbi:hypothetical protein OB905_05645 [Halobacteria archaeon AArc-dxtr1]|nr:hypothetical protein [Halobacteria archaeon AArc-dxtr1]
MVKHSIGSGLAATGALLSILAATGTGPTISGVSALGISGILGLFVGAAFLFSYVCDQTTD